MFRNSKMKRVNLFAVSESEISKLLVINSYISSSFSYYCSDYFSAVKMGAIFSSEKSDLFSTDYTALY